VAGLVDKVVKRWYRFDFHFLLTLTIQTLVDSMGNARSGAPRTYGFDGFGGAGVAPQ
jgi:hypothetical protein